MFIHVHVDGYDRDPFETVRWILNWPDSFETGWTALKQAYGFNLVLNVYACMYMLDR